jgi:anti-sigma28 factor (negative regulator of flagellin synthesis)
MYIEEIGIIEKGLKVRSKRRGFVKLKGLSIKGINPREEEIKRIRKQIMRGEYRMGVIDLARKIVRDEISRLLSSQ